MMIKSRWHLALQIQILLTIIFAIFIPVANRYRTHTLFTSSNFNWLLIGILTILFTANFLRKNFKLNIIVNWLDIFLLPVIFLHYLTGITNKILQSFPAQSRIIVIIFFILYLVDLLPVVMVDYGKVTNAFARILCIIILVLTLLMSGQLTITNNLDFMTNFRGSLISNGLALILLSPFLFHSWEIRLKPDLKFVKTANFQILVLILLLIFGAWYTFFHNYLYIASSFAEMLWQWDLPIIPNWLAFDWSLGSILFEEVYRYLMIIVLLRAFNKYKFQLEIAIFLSALFYGSTHLVGLISGKYVATDIWAQAIFAFGYGTYLAVLYLYSGKIWLPMISHFSLDFLAYSLPGTGGILSLYGNNNLLAGIISAAVTLLVTLLMLFGKRKKFMQENAERMI